MKYIFRFAFCSIVLLCISPVFIFCGLHSLIHWNGRALEFIAITIENTIDLFLYNKRF
jgi:hypothetical protein